MQNHYSSLHAKYKNKSYNPNKGKTHEFEIPARILIVGASGCGKTNNLMNLLKIAFNNTFSHIYLCVKNSDEPLYQQMIDKLGDNLTLYENGDVPRLQDLPKNEESCIIFDDLLNEKNANKEIEEFFKMGRKKGFTSIYLSQSYYKTPKFIRDNLTNVIIKKITSNRELKAILNDYPLGDLNIEQLKKMYTECVKKFENVMMIDLLKGHVYFNFLQRIG
jgi:energy-coupling factor transporter ATP-binding protein EcfA2